RMAWTMRFVGIITLGTLVLSSLSAAGMSEETFSTWYGDMAGRYEIEEVENTGLTVFPTLDIPMGGEYEALGSAYTAAARDVTFLEANPAASSNLENTELAVFHNNLIADTNMESAAYTTRIEDFGTGVGVKYLHVPFTEYDDFGVQQATARYSEAIAAFNVSYNFLNSFYFDGVAAGANVKLAYRNIPEVIVPDQSAAGVMVDFGVLSRFDLLKFYPSRARNFAVGTTLRNVGPEVLEEPLPTVWSIGTAYSPLRPLLLSFDVNVPLLPFSDLSPPGPGYAFGTAVTVTDFFTIRGGYQIKGGNPRINMGGSVRIQDMTVTVNYTLDMTTQLAAFDRFSLQAGFSLGDRGRGARQDTVRALYLDALEAFAAGDLEETIELTDEALILDPTFQPAEETRAMASRMLELQNQMDRIRTGTTENDVLPGEAAGDRESPTQDNGGGEGDGTPESTETGSGDTE
ncbi:MAG: UPF0164 family protein, partial [Alkalispirochaeta sp.]